MTDLSNLNPLLKDDGTIVSGISVWVHRNELGGRVWNPAMVWTHKFAVFTQVHSLNGLIGLGECWCFDASPDALVAFLRTEVAPGLIGKTLHAAKEHCDHLLALATLTARHGILSSALSGIDVALWDIAAQNQDQPLWSTINPLGRGSAPLYGSGGLYEKNKSIDNLVNEMRTLADAGFPIVKMKIGGLGVSEDLERISQVQKVLLKQTKLIIDGVYSYDVETAEHIFANVDQDGIEAFQSPLPADDVAGMCNLVRLGVPVMGVEAEYRPQIQNLLIARRAIKFLQIAPIACGGITRTIALAKKLSRTGISLSLEVSSTAVATLISAHLAAAIENIAHVEYHSLHQVFFDRLGNVGPENPPDNCSLPIRPGLGIDLQGSDVILMAEIGN
jgi:L-alanine-DL-glutamate epimerase-like enolase superfamily enzyme